jgi:tetratricopeptide (TPR) repeat protein
LDEIFSQLDVPGLLFYIRIDLVIYGLKGEVKDRKESLNFRVYALIHKERHGEALNLVDELIKLSKNDNKLFTLLLDTKGDIYKNKQDKKNAIKYYNKSLHLSEKEYLFTNETKEKLKEIKEV